MEGQATAAPGRRWIWIIAVVMAAAVSSGCRSRALEPTASSPAITVKSAPPLPLASAPPPAPSRPEPAEPEPVKPEPTAPGAPVGPGPCPEGMIYIEAEYCTDFHDECLQVGQYNRPYKHPEICHEFKRRGACPETRRRQRFCIDVYEYPNQKGAHPPSMINAWDASALCREQDKRLCWNSEWTIACEGSQQTPFPYGYVRDSARCHQDIKHIRPVYKNMDTRNQPLRDAELTGLDQSLPSGARPECMSDFGVHDLPGNFDEWTFIPEPAGQSRWAATKGGWWGRLRNSCRPIGIGHPEWFVFFPVSTRCCKDPSPQHLPPTSTDLVSLPLWTPPPPPRSSNIRYFKRGWLPPHLRTPGDGHR